MTADTDPWLGALFHGWVHLVTLFLMLLVAYAIIGLCWNRGFRPADRGPVVPWASLILGFGLVLLLRRFNEDLLAAGIIAVAVIIGGLLSRNAEPRGLWVPAMLIAVLLGLGSNLSALLLTTATALVLLLSARQGR
ncbi:MAG: hypothetical protein R2815_00205 [Flavobacteriales bacterium]|nr:hypothetical protein [Flavobacteriales bacterium]